MVGMTPLDCEFWRGELAMAALGRLPAPERLALDGHLAACASCRGDLAELTSVNQALELADPAVVQPDWPGPTGSRPAAGPAPALAGSWRSRLRRRWALGGLAVVAALAGATLFGLRPMPPPGITVALHGTQGVQASAVLTAEHWGTDVSLQVAGQPAGRVYHVSMESTTGAWWPAGSYRSEQGGFHVELACGVDPTQVERIWVEDTAGQVVLRAYVR